MFQTVQCRNHIRAVFPIKDGNILYVCSTGSYSPQEFHLDVRIGRNLTKLIEYASMYYLK